MANIIVGGTSKEKAELSHFAYNVLFLSRAEKNILATFDLQSAKFRPSISMMCIFLMNGIKKSNQPSCHQYSFIWRSPE